MVGLTVVLQLYRYLSTSDDTVEVGSNLYELDTEAEATVEASEAAAPASTSGAAESSPPAPVAAAKAASPAPSKQTQQHRVPSIQFLGKDGWSRVLAGVPELPPLPTNFGRPAFTEEEMEALMMGGANLVPNVKEHSNGAVFGY
jgi:pyruvate/2-oxoglutarate dehydrogenase complex dihydrolipoamide acyltransferase (E2) component